MSSARPHRSQRRSARLTRVAIGFCLMALLAGAGLAFAKLSAADLASRPPLGGRDQASAEALPSVEGTGAGRSGAGGLVEQADRPLTQTVRYEYDPAGRLAAVDLGGGTGLVYAYDAGGNLLRREVFGAPAPSATPTRQPPGIAARIYLPDLARNK